MVHFLTIYIQIRILLSRTAAYRFSHIIKNFKKSLIKPPVVSWRPKGWRDITSSLWVTSSNVWWPSWAKSLSLHHQDVSFQFMPFLSRSFTIHCWENLAHLPNSLPIETGCCSSVPPKSSILQVGQPFSLIFSSQAKWSVPESSWWPFAELTPNSHDWLFCTGSTETGHTTLDVVWWETSRGDNPFLQCTGLNPVNAAQEASVPLCCHRTVGSRSACCLSDSRVPFNRVIPQLLVPSLYYCKRFFPSRCKNLHVSSVNIIRFLLVYFSSISRPFWSVALPLSTSTGPPQFGLMYRLGSSALWGLFQVTDKDCNKTNSKTDSCDTPLITNLQVDYDCLTTVLWAKSWN